MEWFAAENNNQWLLIIDNYDDMSVNIYDFLHPRSLGSILITSRSRDTRRIGKALEVQEVTQDEALEILRRSAHMDMASFQEGMHSSYSDALRGVLRHNIIVAYSDLFLDIQNRATL